MNNRAKILRKLLREELLRENDGSAKKARAAGVKLAQAMEWDGNQITMAYLDALTDANFHSERKRLAPLLSKMFGIEFPAAG